MMLAHRLVYVVDDDLSMRKAIGRLLESEQWLDRSQHKEVRDRLATLTPREFDVLKGVIAGMLNKQIAAIDRGYGTKVQYRYRRPSDRLRLRRALPPNSIGQGICPSNLTGTATHEANFGASENL
jgi:FixJ family two-component response regulator